MRLLAALLALALGPLAWAAEGYVVGPRDVLDVRVYGEENLTGSFVVGADGTIAFGFADRQFVAGKSAEDIEADLSAVLASTYLVNPQVDVEVAEYRSQRVEVLGAVKTPGTFYLEGPTTLSQLLGRAGNVDTERSSREVRVRHLDGTTDVVRVDDLLANGGDGLRVRPGDVVTVPEGQFVFVNGQVGTPGKVLYVDGITASEALSQAGGASELAQLRGAHILRDGERVPVNLRRILLGRDADVLLQPGDQLILRQSPL